MGGFLLGGERREAQTRLTGAEKPSRLSPPRRRRPLSSGSAERMLAAQLRASEALVARAS